MPGLIVMLVISGAVTVMFTVAVWLWKVAVMTVEPWLTDVIRPDESTVATDGLEET